MHKKNPAKVIDLVIDDTDDHLLKRLFSPSNKKPSYSTSLLVNYVTFLIGYLINNLLILNSYLKF